MTQAHLLANPPPHAAANPTDATPDEAARVRLGANLTTPTETLLRLALDPSVTVRVALALNPSAPPAALGVLARDTDERVRALLACKLATLAPCLTEIEQSRLNRQTVAALQHLIEDTAIRVRAAIAEVVKEMPNVPHDLILRLARDTAVEVADPVIRLSPLLTQVDLLALLAANAPAVALAIARRPDLTEDVADALAETDDPGAIEAMLLNRSAQIRESTLDALIARAADHIGWHAPLIRRPDLSPRAAEALSRIVADTLLDELASRADLPPVVTAELRIRLTARLRRHAPTRCATAASVGAAPGAPPTGAPPTGPPPTGAFPSGAFPMGTPATTIAPTGTDDTTPIELAGATDVPAWTDIPTRADGPTRIDALADARARAIGGRLTETELLVVAGRGEARLAAAMLAVAADVPLALVERVATLRSAKGVVSLVWKAGFKMQMSIPLQMLLAHLGPGALLAPGPGGSFPLAIEEMRWQLEFLGRVAPPASPVSAV